MTYIKNDVVQMDWESRCFFESRNQGFIAACKIYNFNGQDVCVIFQRNRAFILMDEEDEPATLPVVKTALKECFDDGEDLWSAYEDDIFMIAVGTSFEEDNFDILVENYGFTEDAKKDIEDRIMDLSGYWVVIEQTAEEMFGDDEDYEE